MQVRFLLPVKEYLNEIKGDYYALRNWQLVLGQSYHFHFIAGLLIQCGLFFIPNHSMATWQYLLLLTGFQFFLWHGKEIIWGLFKISDADYRDARFSVYGTIIPNLLYLLIIWATR